MYKIQYQNYARQPLCYFTDYGVAKECFDILKTKYADKGIIELVPVVPVSSVEEFMDITNGQIRDYEH